MSDPSHSPTPYDDALQNPSASSKLSTSVTVQPWKSAFFEKFGGDIKIVEKKIDMNEPVTEDSLPGYLKNRYISVFVKDFDSSENDWSDLNILIEKDDNNLTEFRTQKKLFPDMWAQIETVIERLSKLEVKIFEIRSTFYCYQSNLESVILKQMLCQELSDILDVLIVTDPEYCKARFFKRAMEPNLKKFSKRVRSTFELTELASRVHAVGLKYNPGPFPSFERHEIVPTGFKFGKEEE
uniref:Uncharacterized protein n=1 Tax=Panagrolaimus sp. ES5 TaxID=591445 RepID=A0AC34FZV0_9BILA